MRQGLSALLEADGHFRLVGGARNGREAVEMAHALKPRPHLLEHDEQFARIEHAYYKRHFVKPGITGLAQSKGYRGELIVAADLANRVHYDAFYVAKWSLGLDVGILFNTARQVMAPPKTAY